MGKIKNNLIDQQIDDSVYFLEKAEEDYLDSIEDEEYEDSVPMFGIDLERLYESGRP